MNQHIPVTSIPVTSLPTMAPKRGARRVIMVTVSLLVLVAGLVFYGFGSTAPSTAPSAADAGGPLAWPGTKVAAKPGNGKLGPGDLSAIGSNLRLATAAAKDFEKLRQGLLAAGHPVRVNSAYRTLAEQEQLVAELGLLSEGGRAAPVGTSEHGLGISVDMTLDAEALAWMGENAAGYGFSRTVEDEPWHWTHTGNSGN